ncbi:terminase [Prauserella flavalba]|uniref:Terminase n=1 Tax=Prauserella flavalba TaxID=1477506 RepID=A0A318LBX7_9PSEU|nr:terminase [Prauserella flavalba]PXY17354.1 terminase [Prauserella flavalba]
MPPLEASPLLSTSYGSGGIVGRTVPRLWTPPLRELTPDTSYGFEVCDFARDVLGHPLDPWQEWVVIHAGELLPDGRPRFRKVLVLVSRQNGKTELLVVLTLYWMYVERVPMVLGTSTKVDYAKESWLKAVNLARRVPELAAEIPRKGGIREANGETHLWRAAPTETGGGSRYKIAASNEEGGRSLTIDRLVLDELRQHHSYEAHDAAVPATNAVRDAQIWALSNAGSDKSIVLNDWRDSALQFIETGEGDPRLGLFEYSAPDGSSPLDLDALAQANPNLGHRIDPDALLGDAKTAMEKGGDKLAGFKTENMCMRVPRLDPAIDAAGWAAGNKPGTLAALRSRVALCLDVAPDSQHVTLAAAAVLPSGRVRVEVVAAWTDTVALRRELPDLVATVRPQVFGWLPNGPAAAVAADLAERKGWPPRAVKVEEIRKDVPAVCMGFADLVKNEYVLHSDDPLLNAQAEAAEKLVQGDAWRFTRRGSGHVDGMYAVAGAVHLARTLPAPVGKPRIIVADDTPDVA